MTEDAFSFGMTVVELTRYGSMRVRFWCRCSVDISSVHRTRYIMPCAWHKDDFTAETPVWEHIVDRSDEAS